MRRRRRRSAFAARQPKTRWFAWGAIAVVIVGAFLFFMHQADVLAPEQHEIRTDLPDAFKE